MAPRKIAKRSSAAAEYAKRTKALRKKAREYNKLCDVQAALVCSPAPGAGDETRLVWESKEGVLDRYLGAVVKPDTHAGHTRRSYLEAELGKERARLARARHGACPGALADWDPALNDMTTTPAPASISISVRVPEHAAPAKSSIIATRPVV